MVSTVPLKKGYSKNRRGVLIRYSFSIYVLIIKYNILETAINVLLLAIYTRHATSVCIRANLFTYFIINPHPPTARWDLSNRIIHSF